MTYTQQTPFSAAHVVSDSDWETYVRQNMEAVRNGYQIRSLVYKNANYGRTGATTWAKVDGTNLTLAVTSSFFKGRLLAMAQFQALSFWTDANATPPYYVSFDFLLDDTIYASTGTSTPSTAGLFTVERGASGNTPGIGSAAVPLNGYFTGVSVGAAHHVDLVWKNDHPQVTATLYCNTYSPVAMQLIEL